MEKTKVARNCLKWRKNWLKVIFEIFWPDFLKLVFENNCEKKEKAKLIKIAWNGKKIVWEQLKKNCQLREGFKKKKKKGLD